MKKQIAILTIIVLAFMAVSEAFGQTRIRFARGRTSATVSGSIGSIGERDFVLRAYAGQYLSANVSSSGGCIWFSTTETSAGYTTENGDNWLKLMNRCRRTATFTMTVSVR